MMNDSNIKIILIVVGVVMIFSGIRAIIRQDASWFTRWDPNDPARPHGLPMSRDTETTHYTGIVAIFIGVFERVLGLVFLFSAI